MEFVVNTVKCKNTAIFISQMWQELLAFQLLKWLFTPEMIQDNKLRHSRLSARLLPKNYSMKWKQTEQKACRLANALEQTSVENCAFLLLQVSLLTRGKKGKLWLCWKKNKYKKDTQGISLKITLDANVSSRLMLRPGTK